jgi:SPP1 gp7 family putative phage head morphogenesis protein
MPTQSSKHFKASVSAENQFARALRRVAQIAAHVVEVHTHQGHIWQEAEMMRQLRDYSERIEPWARRQSAKMLAAVNRKNKTAYQRAANTRVQKQQAKKIGKILKQTVAEAEAGRVASTLMDEQVFLIKSIPLKAGFRAQYLARQAVYEGRRAGNVSQIIQEMDRAGEVSESDAMRIARTEVARSNAVITEARAVAVGAQGYIWRTTMDGAERDSHAKMNGKYVPYNKPPTLSDGTTGHAGTFPNCRCYQDPVFDEG